MNKYRARSTTDNMTIRPDHNTATYYTPNRQIQKNTYMEGNTLWVAPADGTNVKKGDEWLLIVDTAGAPQGWVAMKHMGKVYCTYVIQDEPGEEDIEEIIEVQVTYKNGAGQTKTKVLRP